MFSHKYGTVSFTSDGLSLRGVFTDHLGHSEVILEGDSLGDCGRAISTLVLLMQRRNGIGNFNPDGSVIAGCTVTPADIRAVIDSDEGTGWGAPPPPAGDR